MPNEWVVVLEVARPANAPTIEKVRIEEVLVALRDASPAALIAPDRYALQLHVVAGGPAEALLVALARWRDTAGRMCLPSWELARAEVMVPAELERECDTTGMASAPRPAGMEETDAESLIELAFRDPLTGVATQALFSDCLERALAHGAAVGRVHALVLVELDSVDACMSGYGPPETDRILAAAAPCLVAAVREADVIARLIGDQFAVLLRNVTPRTAEVVAQRIVDLVRVPVPVGNTHVTASATVGVAVSHPDLSAAELVHQAGAALLVAKRKGGNRAVTFTAAGLVPAVATLSLYNPGPPPETSA